MNGLYAIKYETLKHFLGRPAHALLTIYYNQWRRMQAQPCVNLTTDFCKYRLASKQAEMSKLRTPGFISPQLLRLRPEPASPWPRSHP